MFADIVITIPEPNYWLAVAIVVALLSTGLTLIHLGEKDEEKDEEKKKNNKDRS